LDAERLKEIGGVDKYAEIVDLEEVKKPEASF